MHSYRSPDPLETAPFKNTQYEPDVQVTHILNVLPLWENVLVLLSELEASPAGRRTWLFVDEPAQISSSAEKPESLTILFQAERKIGCPAGGAVATIARAFMPRG